MTTASTPLVALAASENKVERVGELFAIFAAILAIGYPVAFEASAEERETRGFTSMTLTSPVD